MEFGGLVSSENALTLACHLRCIRVRIGGGDGGLATASPCRVEERSRTGQHLVDLRFGDVEPPEAVIRIGVLRASACDGVPDTCLHAQESIQQVAQ